MPDLPTLARWLFLAGLSLMIMAGIIWMASRLNIPLGQLPGDLRFQRENLSCFFPLATTLLLSIILTVLVNLFLRMGK
jgi:hypothetical protein